MSDRKRVSNRYDDECLLYSAVDRSPHALDENSNQFSFSHVRLIREVHKLPGHFLRKDHVGVVEHLIFSDQEIYHKTTQHNWELGF